MLPCTDKSKLIHNRLKLANTDETNKTPATNEKDADRGSVSSSATSSANQKVAIVSGMILVQKANDMNIKHVPLTQFLSYEITKADLADYHAKATKKLTSVSHHISIRPHQKQ